MAVKPEPRWVRLAGIAREHQLTADEKIGVLARALTELGIAHGLVLIHGPERGEERYALTRGLVRFDPAGDVWVRVPDD